MNRRNFFLSLAVLPAVVKAVVSAPPSPIKIVPTAPVEHGWYIDGLEQMRAEVLRRVAMTNPYSQLIQ